MDPSVWLRLCKKFSHASVYYRQKVMQNVSHLSLSDWWLKRHCCSNPFSPVPSLQPLLPPAAGGISGSSGSPPAKQVGAVSGGQGKADWGEGSLAVVVEGSKEAQEGRRSPRPLLVHPTLLLILAAFWTLSYDRGRREVTGRETQ